MAYGDSKAADSIKYSGTEVPLVKEHPDILREIQETLEEKLKVRFNHSMLNRYKDGSVHIGSHSDNLGECVEVHLNSLRDHRDINRLLVSRKSVYCVDISRRSKGLHSDPQKTTCQEQ